MSECDVRPTYYIHATPEALWDVVPSEMDALHRTLTDAGEQDIYIDHHDPFCVLAHVEMDEDGSRLYAFLDRVTGAVTIPY